MSRHDPVTVCNCFYCFNSIYDAADKSPDQYLQINSDQSARFLVYVQVHVCTQYVSGLLPGLLQYILCMEEYGTHMDPYFCICVLFPNTLDIMGVLGANRF